MTGSFDVTWGKTSQRMQDLPAVESFSPLGIDLAPGDEAQAAHVRPHQLCLIQTGSCIRAEMSQASLAQLERAWPCNAKLNCLQPRAPDHTVG